MDGLALHPWMLRADWREDRRPFVILDLATWPAAQELEPLPPVPVLALGVGEHPQAWRADVRVEDAIPLARLATQIEKNPAASAVLAQLLRALEGLAAERALPLESMAFAMLQAGPDHAAWLAARREPPAALPGRLKITRQGGVLTLRLERPQARNAIDRTLRDALHDAFRLAELDPEITRVRLGAAGRCFSIGADLAEFGTTRDPVRAHAIRSRTLPAPLMARRRGIYEVHVQGACIGAGLELAAFAGQLTAAPDAWFQLPETAMGILPGFGGCVSVPARIGRQRAAALMLSGQRIGAPLALRWGLIDAIIDAPPGDEAGAHAGGG